MSTAYKCTPRAYVSFLICARALLVDDDLTATGRGLFPVPGLLWLVICTPVALFFTLRLLGVYFLRSGRAVTRRFSSGLVCDSAD